MILDELSKLIREMAKEMKIPIVKIGVFDGDRSMDFRTVKRPVKSRVEPHVVCEIQEDGALKLGKMQIALSEIGVVQTDNAALIKRRLTQAAEDAGVKVGIPDPAVG